MSAKKGSLVLIQIGDGAEPETYAAVGGLRVTKLIINNQLLDNTNLDSGSWRSILPGVGIKAALISGDGIFTDTDSEESLRIAAFASSTPNYRFCFAGGDVLEGSFYISEYQRAGDHENPESYSITMHSAGTLSYTAV